MAGYLIGNYIHYHATNYLKFGATMSQKSAGSALNIDRIIKDKHDAIKMQFQTNVKDSFKEQYEEQINYFFGTPEKKGSLLTAAEKEGTLEKAFIDILKEKFPTIIIDYATLDSSLDGAGGNYGLQAINIHKYLRQGKPVITFKSLESKIKQLSILMDKLVLKSQYTQKDLNKHQALFKKVSDAYIHMFTAAKADPHSSRAFELINKKRELGLNLGKMNIKQKKFINDLNTLIELYNVTLKSTVQGELGELSAAMIGAKLKGIGANELKKFLEKAVIGTTTRSSPGYWQADYSSAFVNLAKFGEETGWEYHNENGGYVKTTLSTQNKIDVEIQTPEGLKTISVKNYALKKGINISAMKGAPFLTLIQNENQDNFINHYFNITAEHQEQGKSESYIDKFRDQMHQLMKQILFINALTGLNISKASFSGEKTNPGAADYFVINDSSKPGYFKIFTMAELLNLTTNNFSGLTKFVKISGYNKPKWNNMWANSGPKERITNILLQAHQIKINAGFSANAIM